MKRLECLKSSNGLGSRLTTGTSASLFNKVKTVDGFKVRNQVESFLSAPNR